MTLTAHSEETLANRCREAIPPDLPTAFDGVVLSIERAPRPDGAEMAEKDRRWPGLIRRIAHAKLRHWGLAHLIDRAELLISELITNGLRYGEGDDIVFRLAYAPGVVRIEVDDGSPGRPYVRETGPEHESGRGMFIVQAIADHWGTSDDGTVTWCTLTVPDPRGKR